MVLGCQYCGKTTEGEMIKMLRFIFVPTCLREAREN